jgi:hypothetical protein
MQSNPAVSVYWLWLTVIGGILAVVPLECHSVSHVYVDGALIGYNDPFPTMDAAGWIVLHAAVSVALAVVATVVHHLWAKRHDPEYHPDSRTFSLGSLLLITAALACVFSLLASLGAIYAIYVVVLLFVAGRIATLLLAAIGL